MYTLENNNTSPLCILCILMPKTRLLTLMLVCMWYEESTPGRILNMYLHSRAPLLRIENPNIQ